MDMRTTGSHAVLQHGSGRFVGEELGVGNVSASKERDCVLGTTGPDLLLNSDGSVKNGSVQQQTRLVIILRHSIGKNFLPQLPP